MNRHKVLELAREVFSSPPITHIGAEKICRFAALIEREVRGDAEPVAWVYDFLNSENRDEVVRNWVTQNPADIEREKGFNVRPLFAHPAPSVVRQLVDALRMVLDDPNALDGRPRTYECVQEALAAAREAGL